MPESLNIGPFEFGPAYARIKGKPAIEDWEGPLSFALWCQRASPWWIGDLLNAGDESFGEVFFQICEGFGISTEMVQRYQSVARRVPRENRRPNLSWSAHAVAARLPIEEQRKVLLDAERKGYTSEELRQRLRGKKGSAAKEAEAPESPSDQS